jgi:hypothetical protein
MATKVFKFEKTPVDQDVIGGQLDGEGLLRVMHAAGKKAAPQKKRGPGSVTARAVKSLAGSALTQTPSKTSRKSGTGVFEGKAPYKSEKTKTSSGSTKKKA